MKHLLLLTLLCLSGCSLIALPIAVVETTASIVKVPISDDGSVADAVSDDESENVQDNAQENQQEDE